LKLNLEIILEKVRAQEAELRALRGSPTAQDKLKMAKEELDKRMKEEWKKAYPKAGADQPLNELDRLKIELKRLKGAKDSDAALLKALEEARLKALNKDDKGQPGTGTAEYLKEIDRLKEELKRLQAEKAKGDYGDKLKALKAEELKEMDRLKEELKR